MKSELRPLETAPETAPIVSLLKAEQAEDGVITLVYKTPYLTPDEWKKRFEKRGFELRPETKVMLNSEEYGSVQDSGEKEVIILPYVLFPDLKNNTSVVEREAERRGLVSLAPSAACHLSELEEVWKVTGLNEIIVNSVSLPDSVGDRCLFAVGHGYLHAFRLKSLMYNSFDREVGFAYARKK